MGEQDIMPRRTLEAFQDWIAKGTHPAHLGAFVRAVLTNDLRAAIGHADAGNLACIREIVGWVYWNAPGGCHGSELALLAYHDRKRDERARDGQAA